METTSSAGMPSNTGRRYGAGVFLYSAHTGTIGRLLFFFFFFLQYPRLALQFALLK